jgi:hypothetical protein
VERYLRGAGETHRGRIRLVQAHAAAHFARMIPRTLARAAWLFALFFGHAVAAEPGDSVYLFRVCLQNQ